MNFYDYVPDKHKNNHLAVGLYVHKAIKKLGDKDFLEFFLQTYGELMKIKIFSMCKLLADATSPTKLNKQQIDDFNFFLDDFFRFYAKDYWKE